MRRSASSLVVAALLLACGLAALGGVWLAVHAPEPVAPPVTHLQRREPEAWSGAGGRPRLVPPREAGGVLPIERWTERFTTLGERQAWEELADLLHELETAAPVVYRANRLGYLHARALLGAGDDDEAWEHLEPFLAAGDPYRPLAL